MDDERLLHPSDEEWAQIESAFPQRRGQSGFERKISNRQAFEAVLHRARVGCPWRDLPAAYGGNHAIYMRWKRWVKSGGPQRALIAAYLDAAERGELDLSLAMDRLPHRACPPARRRGTQKKGGDQALGRSRGGLSTKTHTASVSEPRVLEGFLSGGQAGDAPAGEGRLAEVLAYEEIEAVGGDRACDSDAIRALSAAAGKEAVIPPRCNRRRPAVYDKEKYKKRHKAARLFNKLKGYRAVATRYDKLAAMFLGGVLAALLAISLKCIVSTP